MATSFTLILLQIQFLQLDYYYYYYEILISWHKCQLCFVVSLHMNMEESTKTLSQTSAAKELAFVSKSIEIVIDTQHKV